MEHNIGNKYYEALVEHAATHRLRDCRQAIFTDPDGLARHLELDHDAIKPLSHDPELAPWRVTQAPYPGPTGSMNPPRTFIGDICRHITAGAPIPVDTPVNAVFNAKRKFRMGEASRESLRALWKDRRLQIELACNII